MDDLPFTMPYIIWAGFYNLPAKEKEAIKAALAPFAKVPEEEWPRLGAKKLTLKPVEYLIPVGEKWRAFLRPNPGGLPELADIVPPARLELFAPKKPRGKQRHEAV